MFVWSFVFINPVFLLYLNLLEKAKSEVCRQQNLSTRCIKAWRHNDIRGTCVPCSGEQCKEFQAHWDSIQPFHAAQNTGIAFINSTGLNGLKSALLFICSKLGYSLHWNHWFPCARISTGRGRFYQILQHFLSPHFKKSADISYRIVLLRLENPMPTHVIKTFSPPMCSSSGVFVSILNMIWKKLLRCRRNSIVYGDRGPNRTLETSRCPRVMRSRTRLWFVESTQPPL